MAFSYTVELSEKRLQKKVSAMMPMEASKYYLTVTLSEPEIELIEGRNEIGVFTHIEVVVPKIKRAEIKGSGRTKITGSLSYESERCEFFFKNPVIEMLEIDKVSERYIPVVKSIVQFIAQKILAKLPVYRLKDENLKHKLAKSMLQSITVKDKKLLLKLSLL